MKMTLPKHFPKLLHKPKDTKYIPLIHGMIRRKDSFKTAIREN